MKKRFLPFGLLLVIMILGQSMTIADNGGHYVPRTQGTPTAERFMSELRVNQHTGLIDPALMIKATQNAAKNDPYAPNESLYWLSMGPDNMGGQTTAILYDNKPNAHGNLSGVVYIGSMGGGVYKSYNYGITWHQVGGIDLMVSCLAQDADGNIYVGTGDGNNAVSYNGLGQQGYDNSFIGSGVYKIDADDAMTLLEATAPITEASGWAYVNDIAVVGNMVVAGTDAGVMYSNDKGLTWSTALEGKCVSVKATTDNTLIVAVDGKVFIGTIDNLVCHSDANIQYDEDGVIIALPTAAGMLDIATAPSDANTVYASFIGADGKHTGIYVSYDKGATWAVALPTTTPGSGHNVYEGYGIYNHGIMVDPSSNGTLYVLGYNLWKMQRPANGQGYFIVEQMTDGGMYAYYENAYLHVGLHAMTFNPNNAKECYIGTDGGIYKATIGSDGAFSFKNCNRNYITTRMFSVGVSGNATRVLAAGLDHGTVIIEGNSDYNTMGYAQWINPMGTNMGVYSENSQAGPCTFSAINANTIFVTTMGGDVRLYRSETAGEDWVSTNFISSSTITIDANSFRLPILLYENYDDEMSPEKVWYFNTTESTQPTGTEVQCKSNNNYPFTHTLTAPLAAGDSIEVHDPISAKLYVATKDALYVTRTPLNFSVEAEWYKLAGKKFVGFVGEPLCEAISADGDNMFVGMKNGMLYRVAHLNTVIDATSGNYIAKDSLNHDIMNPDCLVVTDTISLPVSGQCITSIAFDPRNANNVIVTCGNYGNDSYVFYSNNALADNPTFVSKQAQLPKMPVYSSLVEMSTGDVIIGTERGIYRTKNITSSTPNWVADSKMMGEVPVMELKQQLLHQEDRYIVLMSPEDTVVNVYPGVSNTGIIYAATYGRGVMRCENYKLVYGDNIPEIPATVVETNVMVYPNPAHEQATVKFETEGNADVNYQVFDLTGRIVMQKNLGRMAAGSYEINVNTSDLSTGSYILRLTTGTHNSSVKFLVY